MEEVTTRTQCSPEDARDLQPAAWVQLKKTAKGARLPNSAVGRKD